jgi:hypothetical protein
MNEVPTLVAMYGVGDAAEAVGYVTLAYRLSCTL